MFNGIACHQTTGTLGVEADDLVSAAFPVLEHRLDQFPLDLAPDSRLEIFLGSQIDGDRASHFSQFGIDRLEQGLAPESVEVLARIIFELGPHFQTIGLHQVERAQDAVEPGQDAHVVLRESQGICIHLLGRQTIIDIAIKGQYRLLGVFRRKRLRPFGVTREIQQG